MEEDLYEKAEKEFWSIINQEKKNMEKKKEADMDKSDMGKVTFKTTLSVYYLKSLGHRALLSTNSYIRWR